MKYKTQEWTIEQLIESYDRNLLRLNPPYQRNPIWSLRAQQLLLDTILTGQPLPNFFFLLGSDSIFEVVDGQQRIRTVVGYWKNLIPDLQGFTLERRLQATGDRKTLTQSFLSYRISICVLSDLSEGESIEHFYRKVNSTGLRLNRPELNRASYLTTNFLRLLQKLTDLPDLKALRLFSSITSARLNDLDFVSELVAALKFGISDKKEKVDELFNDDISDAEFDSLDGQFQKVIAIINRFDHVRPIIRTRYKQKNDFYTLFYFVSRHSGDPSEVLEYFYQVLVKIGPFIRPSQEECEPLMQYAFHCVTQSNSKAARLARNSFLENLLLNRISEPNDVQGEVAKFFAMSPPLLRQVGVYHTLNCATIVYPEQTELSV
jgi:hypothetical protein